MGYFSSYENLKELFSALRTSAMSFFAKKEIYGDNIINGQDIKKILLNYNGLNILDEKNFTNTTIIGQKNNIDLPENSSVTYTVIGDNNTSTKGNYKWKYSWSTNWSYVNPNNIYMFGRYNKAEGNINIAYLYGGSNSITWKDNDYSGYSGYTQEHANLFGYGNSINGNIQASDRTNLFGAENSINVTTNVLMPDSPYSRPKFSMCSLFGYRNSLSITNNLSETSDEVKYINIFGMDNSSSWEDEYTSGLNMIGYSNYAKNPGDNNYLFGKSNKLYSSGDYSFAYGSYNEFYDGSNYTYLYGHYNYSYEKTSYSSLVGLYNNSYKINYSLLSGYENEVHDGSYFYVLGGYNSINKSKTIKTTDEKCAVIGYENTLNNTIDTYVFGSSNYVSETNNTKDSVTGYSLVIGRTNTLKRYDGTDKEYRNPSHSFIFGYVNSLHSTYYTTANGINNYAQNVINTYQAGQGNNIYGNKSTCSGYLQIGYNNYIENAENYIQVGANNKILSPDSMCGSINTFGSSNIMENASGSNSVGNSNNLSYSNGSDVFGNYNKLKYTSGSMIVGSNNDTNSAGGSSIHGNSNIVNNYSGNVFGSSNSISSCYGTYIYGSSNNLTSSSSEYVYGNDNKLSSSSAGILFGYSNELTNSNTCFVVGNYNKIKSNNSIIFGNNLSAKTSKIVIGGYNEDKSSNIFEVGFGDYNNNKNIFEINSDEEVVAKDYSTRDGIKFSAIYSSIKYSNELREKTICNLIKQQNWEIIYDGYGSDIDVNVTNNSISITYNYDVFDSYCEYGYVIMPDKKISPSDYYVGTFTVSSSALIDEISGECFSNYYKSEVNNIRIIIYKMYKQVSIKDFLQLKSVVDSLCASNVVTDNVEFERSYYTDKAWDDAITLKQLYEMKNVEITTDNYKYNSMKFVTDDKESITGMEVTTVDA